MTPLQQVESRFSHLIGNGVAADWCDEQDGIDWQILAAWLRSGDELPSIKIWGGSGSGSGDGSGSGCGYGGGSGYGSGVKKHSVGELLMPSENDYVCVRSRDMGVCWGYLVWRFGRECRLRNARQQHSWSSNALALPTVVSKHPTTTGLRLSETVEEIDMTETLGRSIRESSSRVTI